MKAVSLAPESNIQMKPVSVLAALPYFSQVLGFLLLQYTVVIKKYGNTSADTEYGKSVHIYTEQCIVFLLIFLFFFLQFRAPFRL